MNYLGGIFGYVRDNVVILYCFGNVVIGLYKKIYVVGNRELKINFGLKFLKNGVYEFFVWYLLKGGLKNSRKILLMNRKNSLYFNGILNEKSDSYKYLDG